MQNFFFFFSSNPIRLHQSIYSQFFPFHRSVDSDSLSLFIFLLCPHQLPPTDIITFKFLPLIVYIYLLILSRNPGFFLFYFQSLNIFWWFSSSLSRNLGQVVLQFKKFNLGFLENFGNEKSYKDKGPVSLNM